MITIYAGGKPHRHEFASLIAEFEQRLTKPYCIQWQFYDEAKLLQKLETWPFDAQRDFVICCDERGRNLSSPELAQLIEKQLQTAHNLVFLIGGAYGFPEVLCQRANLVWSFSRLVFPHQLARLILSEQIYRAQEIAKGSKYHHE